MRGRNEEPFHGKIAWLAKERRQWRWQGPKQEEGPLSGHMTWPRLALLRTRVNVKHEPGVLSFQQAPLSILGRISIVAAQLCVLEKRLRGQCNKASFVCHEVSELSEVRVATLFFIMQQRPSNLHMLLIRLLPAATLTVHKYARSTRPFCLLVPSCEPYYQ